MVDRATILTYTIMCTDSEEIDKNAPSSFFWKIILLILIFGWECKILYRVEMFGWFSTRSNQTLVSPNCPNQHRKKTSHPHIGLINWFSPYVRVKIGKSVITSINNQKNAWWRNAMVLRKNKSDYILETTNLSTYTLFLSATRLLSLQPRIFGQKFSNTLSTNQPQIWPFLQKQLIFTKTCKNQLWKKFLEQQLQARMKNGVSYKKRFTYLEYISTGIVT